MLGRQLAGVTGQNKAMTLLPEARSGVSGYARHCLQRLEQNGLSDALAVGGNLKIALPFAAALGPAKRACSPDGGRGRDEGTGLGV